MVRMIDVDGRPTRCRIVRTKPKQPKDAPLTIFLLIHGIACSSEAWAPLLDHVRNTLQDQKLAQENPSVGEILYIAPDLPGFGFTPLLPEESIKDINQLADFCFRLLHRYVNVDTCVHVVGNSMGCQVTVSMARRWTLHNINLNSIILCGPTVGGAISIPKYFFKLTLDSFVESFSYNVTLLWMFWRQGIFHYLRTVWHMVTDTPLKNLPLHASRLESKQNERFIMLIRGTKDPIASTQVRDMYVNGVMQSLKLQELELDVDGVLRIEEVEGHAHAVQFNGPSDVIALFADFMNETVKSAL
jgi:pimeloyl-ACP methyl ester carboxylesterase